VSRWINVCRMGSVDVRRPARSVVCARLRVEIELYEQLTGHQELYAVDGNIAGRLAGC